MQNIDRSILLNSAHSIPDIKLPWYIGDAAEVAFLNAPYM